MALLSYSTDAEPTLAAPSDRKTPWYIPSPRLKFVCIFIMLASAALTFGYLLNGEIGLLTVLVAAVPFAGLVTASFFVAPRSELPLPLRLSAVAWGGMGATLLTLLIVSLLNGFFGDPATNVSVTVQAPLVEEFCKGMFVLTLFFFFKHQVRTPLAGAMLGFLVGAGFAFIENILYFTTAFNTGGWAGFWQTVAMRAVLSFFIHPMATMCTGLFIGYVVSKANQYGFWRKAGFLLLGPLAAMTFHGLWNGLASLSTDGTKWNLTYFFFWVPLVLTMGFVVIMVRRAYLRHREGVILAAVSNGYLLMPQAEKVLDAKARKALYKAHPQEMLHWESAMLRLVFWDSRLAVTKKERRVERISQKKSAELRTLTDLATLL